MDKRIVTLTINPALDKITGVPQVVANQKLRCNNPKYEAGGGGINVSRAIHRLEGNSLAIFPSGGSNGDRLERKLEQENINFLSIPIKGSTRENLTIFEGNSQQQFRFIMPGPMLEEQEWKQTLDAIRNIDPQPDYLIASGSIPLGVPDDYYQQIAEIAKDIECKLIVDTSGEALKLAAEEGVYLLKPNMRELGNLVGKEIESEAHQIEASQSLIDSGKAQVIVVSLGAGGALLITEDQQKHLRTPTVPIRSKLGAGDSMVGAIALKLAQGENILDATRYGIAAGAAAVLTEGIELCTKSDTDRLYERLIERETA